jgi:T4 RnlA family RNA ligase
MIKGYKQFILEKNSNSEYYIPTYEEARLICDSNDNFIFYESKHNVEGFGVSIFNYRLAFYSHFTNPVPDRPEIKAHEMRGLTFVFNEDGTIYNRFLLLDKFFNVDQTPCSMYSVLKGYKIKNIYNKEDGSIASFIKLPNGKVVGRSKAAFGSDQAIEIQKIYEEDPNIRRFVDWSLDREIIPIFEFVSPRNRIVLPYTNTELILLRLRNNATGEYLDIDDYSDQYDGISVVASDSGKTLDDLIELRKITPDKEGWIVQFENGKMAKIKTEWYLERHRLYTDSLNRENDLIKMIIDGTIDDVFPNISDERKMEIESTIDKINGYILDVSKKVDDLVSDYDGSKRDFAIKNNKHPLFSIAIGVINGKDKLEMIKGKILSDTRDLMKARKWIDSI